MQIGCHCLLTLVSVHVYFTQEHPSFSSRLPFPEEGALPEESAPMDNEAPETTKRRDVDEFEDFTKRTESNQSPPSASSKGGDGGKKRKHQRI
jgi:hypothetical protein